MTRRTGKVTAALLAVALGVVTLQASCGLQKTLIVPTRARVSEPIPKRYENWVLTYSTGDSKVYTKRLAESPPQLLFEAEGELDYGTLWNVPERSSVVYESLRAGGRALSVFSYETGKHDTVAADVTGPIRLLGEDIVYVASANGGGEALWEWSADARKAGDVFRAASLQCQGSSEPSAPVLFSVARSDPAVDPIDQDLYYLPGRGAKARKIASAPHRYGFEGSWSIGGDVYYMLVELGGEMHGTIRAWSKKTGETTDVVSHASLLDVARDGSLLLLEPAPTQPAMAMAEETRERQRLRLVSPDGSDRVFEGEYLDEPLARIAGNTVLVAQHDGKQHRLDAFDMRTGEKRTLHHSSDVRVSEIEPIDDGAVACVLDRIGGDGLSEESRLVWMPVDGGDAVELTKTTSGFIHMAPPVYCEG